MQPCALVVCELNPFHEGHAYLFKKIREKLGEDCRIICLMSGNTVQRGEFAIFEKHERASAAIDGGADLVLELPHPFSASGAQIFASKAVEIADSLGVVDYLAFGSECADMDKLSWFAEKLSCDEYNTALKNAVDISKGVGYPSLRAKVFEESYKMKLPSAPNDTLGIEYLSALKKQSSKIKPICIARKDCEGASAVRERLRSEGADGISNSEEAYSLMLSNIRLQSDEELDAIADMPVGLGARMKKAAMSATGEESYFSFLPTKIYTRARLRRLTLYASLGLKSDDLILPASYTFVLSSNAAGRELLGLIRRKGRIKAITSCSSVKALGEDAKRLLDLSLRCDSLYSLTFKEKKEAAFSLKTKPIMM